MEWCPGSVGHGWEIVDEYISGQKGYCYKTDTVPVVVVAEEKEKALKIGYMTLYAKLLYLLNIKW